MRVLQPPAPLDVAPGEWAVFLAGSIEQGGADDWQARTIAALADLDGVALNPRRAAWDATWPQTAADPRFRGQVEWELDGLARADVIAMWFEPATRSPVTLLELGLFAASGKLVVGCPDGFWRKGNVEIVCERHRVPLVARWDDLVAEVRSRRR